MELIQPSLKIQLAPYSRVIEFFNRSGLSILIMIFSRSIQNALARRKGIHENGVKKTSLKTVDKSNEVRFTRDCATWPSV